MTKVDAYSDYRHKQQRAAIKLRATNNRFDLRRAERIEGELTETNEQREEYVNILNDIGSLISTYSASIDAAIPQNVLLDLLCVNIADRGGVEPDDGIMRLTFAKGLEQSAYYRGGDRDHRNQGPFTCAVTSYMLQQFSSNKILKQKADEFIFGTGGILEFIPTFKENGEGEMVRQRPRLRLAEACDRAKIKML
jgi:hypothetical protein